MAAKVKSILISVLFLLAYSASGQNYPMLHYTIDNGIPSNIIRFLLRDHLGFVWIATDKGVAKYNGTRFEVFTTFNGLPGNDVSYMTEDMRGRVWLVTSSGDLCYYKDDSFITPLLDTREKIERVIPQKDSSVIIMLKSESKFLNITTKRTYTINTADIPNRSRLGLLLYTRKIGINRYQLTFTNQSIIVDTAMQIKQQFDVDTFKLDVTGTPNAPISVQNRDYLYNSRNLYNSDLTLRTSFPASFHTYNFLNTIWVEKKRKFFGTNNGLYLNDTIRLLPEHNITSLTADSYGNYYIGTQNNGLYILHKNFTETQLLTHAYDGQALFAKALYNTLFFATTDNNLYALKQGEILKLVNHDAQLGKANVLYSSRAFTIDSTLRFASVTNNDLLYKPNVFEKQTTTLHSDILNSTMGIQFMSNSIYARKSDGVFRIPIDSISKGSGISRLLQTSPEEPIYTSGKETRNAIWVSSANGLYTISSSGLILFQRQFRDIQLKNFIVMDDDIIGTTTGNLLLIIHSIHSSATVDTLRLQNCIWDKLYKIDATHILVSTNNLYRLLTIDQQNRDNYTLTIIDDPFIPLQPEMLTSDGNRIYFLKGGAISAFSKRILIGRPPAPTIFFTQLRTGNSTYKVGRVISMPFSESHNITIAFSAVSFPGCNETYQYSISKTEADYWTDIKGEEINLVNSGYGSYVVKVRARLKSGQYTKPSMFVLKVTRPYWATWWFVVLSALAIVAVIVFISRRRIAYILAKKDKEHAVQVRFMKSEYKALNALMNPHFIFNTLNNVQGLINKNDKQAANEYLRVIADLIRQNMHNISKELIPLQKEVDLVSNYLLLEKLRFKERLNYTVIVDREIDLSEILVPPLLIQPLVENSIKHGILPMTSGEGVIYVNIFERNNDLHIEVKDNGVGLNYKKSEKLSSHESFGLENIRKRIQQLSVIQSKNISFQLGERMEGDTRWTVVSIVIPNSY